MKKFVNDPRQFVPEMLKGIALANPDTLRYVPTWRSWGTVAVPAAGTPPSPSGSAGPTVVISSSGAPSPRESQPMTKAPWCRRPQARLPRQLR